MVIGGGAVAERKVRGLLESGGVVRVISPEIRPGLAALHKAGKIQWLARPYGEGDLAGAFLVFAATDNQKLQTRIAAQARAAGILVNVANSPADCGFQVPAVCRRGDLTLTVSTSGLSPAVAAMVRARLEKEFGPEYDLLLQLVSTVRDRILQLDLSQDEKKKLFQKLLHPDIVGWIRDGRWKRLQAHCRHVLGKDFNFDSEFPTKSTPVDRPVGTAS